MDTKNKSLICDLCNITISSEQQRQSHLIGKKHQLALHQANVLDAKEKCGIYVKGFPISTKPEELVNFLSNYGKIVDFFFAENNSFAMLQFNSPTPVEVLLKKRVEFSGKWLVINRRIVRKKEASIDFVQHEENFEEMNKSLKAISNFEDQVKALISLLQPNLPDMMLKYDLLCIDLRQVLSEIFPNCIVYPFGSTITGLSFATSDVDVYVKVYDVNGTIPPHDSKASAYVIKSKKWLEKYPRIFSHLCSIPRAKTPIVKLVHSTTKLSCDINFKNMLGVCNTYLIKYYLSLDSKLTPIMMILKYWAKLHELSGGSGKFSNYSLIMIFIFYLQSEKYSLPSVEVLQDQSDSINMQEGWNGGFTPLSQFRNNVLKSFTISQILHGFFEYYANFDFTLNVICPYLGRTMLKTDFLKPECLPDTFKLYKSNIAVQHSLRVESPICIQDPLEHNHNLSNSIPSRVFEDFVKFCRIGAEIFKNEVINSTSLYKLFTENTELALLGKSTHANNEGCRFSLVMDSNCLLHLNNIANSNNEETTDPDEKVNRIKFAWYDVANTFILDFLTKIMKFSVRLKTNTDDSKAQRLNEQSDIHDTGVVETVGYCCSGFLNLWEARKSIARDLHVDPNIGFLQKQINVSEYMFNLYKKHNVTNAIIEFEFNAIAKVNPVVLFCDVVKIKGGNHFVSFVTFLVRCLPHWFIKYCKELDENVNK